MRPSLILFLCLFTPTVFADQAAPSLAPGYQALGFPAPVPGTYQLPVLGSAADGKVVDSNNKDTSLHQLFGRKVTVLSFIYSTCSDVNGCPLATMVLHIIHSRLTKDPELAQRIRLLTLSFNPEQDTPEAMRRYGADFQGQNLDWQFLTTRSETELQPILQSYRQNIQKVYAADGKFTGTYNHDLRVYLIDENQQIRNIYSVAFLHADTLIGDIKTLLQGKSNTPANTAINTYSQALSERVGKATDLLKTVKKPPLGLPALPVPTDNPLNAAKISLGRKLFYDRRLSLNNTVSCAMCHVPEQGFTSNEMATAVGIEGRTVKRNSPTLYNVGYAQLLFHDGRENSLEQQVWGPLLAHNEMANPSIGYVINKIKSHADYKGLFEKAFAKPAGMETIGMALASYQRTLNSANSPFDRWYFKHDKTALDETAQRGFQLFTGKAGCAACHSINAKHALFTDQKLHNTGLGYAQAMQADNESQKVQLAPKVFAEVSKQIIQSVSEAKTNDLGRYEISQNPADRWQYKTPSLRNIALTAPYMHNGSLSSLREVVEFYNRGGVANENLDPLIKPLNLSGQEIDELVAFLMALTGDNVDELVGDAIAAPIGDSK
jgi:cytochrome c peroxidase